MTKKDSNSDSDFEGIQPNNEHHWPHQLEIHNLSQRCSDEGQTACCKQDHTQACPLRQPEDEGVPGCADIESLSNSGSPHTEGPGLLTV